MHNKDTELKQIREDIKEAYFRFITDHRENATLHEDMDTILKRLARYLLCDYPEYLDIIAIYEKAEDDFWYS